MNIFKRSLRKRNPSQVSVQQRALSAVKAFLATETWDEAFAMLERERSLLLTDHVDQFLTNVLTEAQYQLEHRDNADMFLKQEIFYLRINRQVLRSAGSFSLAVLKAQCKEGMSDETKYVCTIPSTNRACIAFINASWEGKRLLLMEEEALLLKPRAEALLSFLLMRYRYLDWELCRLLLRRSREVGIAAAWSEFERAYPRGKRPEDIHLLYGVDMLIRPHPLMLLIGQLGERTGKENQEISIPDAQHYLTGQALEAFLCSPLSQEKKSVLLQKQTWLLTEEAKQRLRRYSEQAREQKYPELAEYLDIHSHLLDRGFEIGIDAAWDELEEERRVAQNEPPKETAFHDVSLDPLFRELMDSTHKPGRERKIELLRQLIEQVEAGLGDELTRAMLYYALAEMSPGETLAEQYEEAIRCYQQTLSVYTPERFPHIYVEVQSHLAILYGFRMKGSRGDNIEAAIQCNREVIRTVSLLSQKVLSPLNNLGMLLTERTRENTIDNLKQAIVCLNLHLFLADPSLESTIGAKLNLSRAHADLARLGAHIFTQEQGFEWAIAYSREALDALHDASLSQVRVGILSNLGLVYMDRPHNSLSEDMEQAIACFEEGLELCKQHDFPAEHAVLLHNLANVYTRRVLGERSHNLQVAIEYLEQSLRIWPFDIYPHRYVSAHVSKANSIFHFLVSDALHRGDKEAMLNAYEKAAEAYDLAIKAQTRLGWQEMDEEGRGKLLGEEHVRDMYVNYAWCLWQLGKTRQAAIVLETGKAQTLSESVLIEEWLLRATCEEHRAAFMLAEQNIRQSRATHDHTRMRQARDHLLKIHQIMLDCPVCKRSGPFSFEPTYQQIAHAADSTQALVYLVATSYGGFALIVPPARELERGKEHDPIVCSLPGLTSQRVRDWLVAYDQRGNPARGFYVPINALGEKFLDQWNYSSGTSEASLQMTISLQNIADNLPEAMSTMRQAFRELVREWSLQADLWDTGGVGQQEKARKLREQLQRPFNESLLLGTIKKEIDWYLQKAELDYVLPELGDVIMTPLRNALNSLKLDDPGQQIAFIPYGFLCTLPLHAAFVCHPRTGKMVPFCETCEYTYQPGARALARTRSRANSLPEYGPVITVGNPRPTRGENLYFAQEEAYVNAEQGRRTKRPGSRAIVAESATLTNVRDALLKSKENHDGSWIDIAAHGYADLLNPQNCYMLLAQNEKLSLATLRQEQLLSGIRCFCAMGCSTGKIDLFLAPDELNSFAIGVLQAGAASAIATLWSVSDEASFYLMVRFYQLILEHPEHSPAWAMREATSWLRMATHNDLSNLCRECGVNKLAFSLQRGEQDFDERKDRLRGITSAEQIGQRSTTIIPTQTDFVYSSCSEKATPYAHPIHWAAAIVYGA